MLVIFIAIKNFSCISSVIKKLAEMTESMEETTKKLRAVKNGKEVSNFVSFTNGTATKDWSVKGVFIECRNIGQKNVYSDRF